MGEMISAEGILKIFQEKLNKPLKPLKPYRTPAVEVQLHATFQDAFELIVSKKDIEAR